MYRIEHIKTFINIIKALISTHKHRVGFFIKILKIKKVLVGAHEIDSVNFQPISTIHPSLSSGFAGSVKKLTLFLPQGHQLI